MMLKLTELHPFTLLSMTMTSFKVPAGSPSRGGDVAVYVLDINQSSLPTSFHSVLGSISAFMALSTVFHSINPPENYLLSHLFFLSYICLIGPFN